MDNKLSRTISDSVASTSSRHPHTDPQNSAEPRKQSEDWPNFYIIGAPKCGTTGLATYLKDHPQISFSLPKEPHFFVTDFEGIRIIRDAHNYFRCFPRKADPKAIRGEGSVWYLYSEQAVPNILEVRPDAKFIVMVRNPSQAAVSLHNQLILALYEDVRDFEQAWRLQDLRRRGEHVPARCREPKTLIYGDVYMFGAQLARLYEWVDRSQVKVIVFDDFKADPARVYAEVLSFLGVAHDHRNNFPLHNKSRTHRSKFLHGIIYHPSVLRKNTMKLIRRGLGVQSFGIRRFLDKLNTYHKPYAPISEAMEKELRAHFRSDVEVLADLIGRDLKDWQ